MSFNSLQFLIFLPIVLLVYWILPHKIRWVFLLIASYYFYMSWNPWLVFLILGTTLTSYIFAILIEKAEKENVRKLCLWSAIIICLGVLVFFKYFNFLVQSAIDFLNLFSLHINSIALDLILPVGISFYTFQTLSYVIDVYRKKYPAEKHFGYYALYVSYFPQLVAGPIETPGNLLPQLKEEHHLNADDVVAGLKFLSVGFFRKVCVSDILSIYVTNAYSNLENINSLGILIACLLFTFQIYNDFGGYSEIALGCARIMGVKLTQNFNQPFLSLTYSEFFRRWHITLNNWFRDYLYIPLGGNRKGKARKILNTWIVFGLCGLWHGAKWSYVLWGLSGALFVSLESLLRKPVLDFYQKHNIDIKTNHLFRGIGHVYFFFVSISTSVLFRASDFTQIGNAYKAMFTKFGFSSEYFLSTANNLSLTWSNTIMIILLIIAMSFLFYFAYSKPRITSTLPEGTSEKVVASYFAQEAMTIFLAVTLIAIGWIFLLQTNGNSAFAYFQF